MVALSAEQSGAIIALWFGLDSAKWFERDAALDAQLRERFGELTQRAIKGEFDPAPADVRTRLAMLLLLDQFPRNLHRGEAQAFAGAAQAERIAGEIVEAGEDKALTLSQRLFVYLPFEHAEDLARQDRSIALFTAMANDAPPSERAAADNYLAYARKHREAIARFGRFPSRNLALGRMNTPEEQAWLDAGNGF